MARETSGKQRRRWSAERKRAVEWTAERFREGEIRRGPTADKRGDGGGPGGTRQRGTAREGGTAGGAAPAMENGQLRTGIEGTAKRFELLDGVR